MLNTLIGQICEKQNNIKRGFRPGMDLSSGNLSEKCKVSDAEMMKNLSQKTIQIYMKLSLKAESQAQGQLNAS